jgi:hypothetical protein
LLRIDAEGFEKVKSDVPAAAGLGFAAGEAV